MLRSIVEFHKNPFIVYLARHDQLGRHSQAVGSGFDLADFVHSESAADYEKAVAYNYKAMELFEEMNDTPKIEITFSLLNPFLISTHFLPIAVATIHGFFRISNFLNSLIADFG